MAAFDYIVQTGVIVPDTTNTLVEVQQEYLSVFGQDLNLNPETPQGILIAAETASRDATARNNALLANQINPDIAGGVFLDALCALTGLSRLAGTFTTVNATLSGEAGTVIPAGSEAKTTNGDLFAASITATIPPSGSVAVIFAAVEAGAIECGIGDLSEVVTPILGWETITNTAAGVLGQAQESDTQLRNRRRLMLGLQSQGTPEAIIAGLYNTSGVSSVLFRENVTSAAATIDGKLLSPHSIYCVVQGGTDLDVATTILSKKNNCSDYNGATVVDVTNEASGQVYSVKFDRPTAAGIKVRVTAQKQVRSGVDSDIKYAVMQWAAGNVDSSSKLDIGKPVSPYEIAGAINRQMPSITVYNVEIGFLSGAYGVATLPVDIWVIPTLQELNIDVVLV